MTFPSMPRIAAAVAGALLSGGIAAAPAHETPDSVATADIVPQRFVRSAHFELAPAARARDNFYRFTVATDELTYEVTSLAMLRVRLHEIATIAEVTPRLGKSNITLDRSPGGRRGVGSDRVVDILADPVGTASQLLGNIQYNVEQTFGERDQADTQTPAAQAGRDLNPGPHKRSAAAQLGVDVYSTNPALQRLLGAVADARSAGKTASSFSPLVRNVYAADPFGSGALDARLDSEVKNLPAEELHARVDAALARLGIAPALRIALLTHPAYSPRTRLTLTAYLDILQDVAGLARIVAAAGTAETEADALAYVGYARMLAFNQLNGGGLVEVVTETRFPTLATAGGDAVLALPLDYLAWTPAVEAAADSLDALREERGLATFAVLLAGAPTERAAAALAERGVEVRPHYSF